MSTDVVLATVEKTWLNAELHNQLQLNQTTLTNVIFHKFPDVLMLSKLPSVTVILQLLLVYTSDLLMRDSLTKNSLNV
jgi:hypothetical protein